VKINMKLTSSLLHSCKQVTKTGLKGWREGTCLLSIKRNGSCCHCYSFDAEGSKGILSEWRCRLCCPRLKNASCYRKWYDYNLFKYSLNKLQCIRLLSVLNSTHTKKISRIVVYVHTIRCHSERLQARKQDAEESV
jgi:hypothetical protein